MMKGLRIIGILAMAATITHCGDSDVNVSTGTGVVPAPGTFTGTLSDGGSIRLEVGSIEAVAFDCDDERIQQIFTPPRPINGNGTFDVTVLKGSREFRVTGTFLSNNTVDGSIDDEDNECDASYEGTRGGIVPTSVPTPTFTPNNGVTATRTPGGGPTDVTPTRTGAPPSGATLTPTPAGSPCPIGVSALGTAGDAKILDTGWTGIAHNQPVIDDSTFSTSLSDCANEVRPCGVCTVGGPIPNPQAGNGQLDSQRCVVDTSIRCTNDTDCPSGKCAFFFGAPLPLSAGGVSTCVTNQVDGPITGTANVETGVFTSNIKLKASVFLVDDVSQPCSLCNNDPTLNDSNKDGTCSGGPKNGMPCDGNGRSTLFGTTSFDCPSALTSRAAILTIALDGGSTSVTRTLSASSSNCSDATGKKCFCPPGAGGTGAGTRPSSCVDDTGTSDLNESLCVSAGSPNEGKCPGAPVDQTCQRETFIGCNTNADCGSGDPCVVVPRPCYLDNGEVGGSITAAGMSDPPSNGEADPIFASLFCIPHTGKSAIDTVAGLPGLGRITLPLHTTEIPAP